MRLIAPQYPYAPFSSLVSTNSVQSPGVITQAERALHSLKALLRTDIAPMMPYVRTASEVDLLMVRSHWP